MQSYFMAIADFLAGLFCGNFYSKFIENKIEKSPIEQSETAPVGYKPLYFNCWLCTGENRFACKPLKKEKKFNMECKWCGVENLVTVQKEK